MNSIESNGPGALESRAERSRQAWKQLGLWLRGITPRALVRFLFASGIVILLVWLAIQAKTALIPFIAGAVLAYVLLPVVNWLDKFLPRWFASIFTMVSALAFLALFLSQLIPLLINQVEYAATILPDEAILADYADRASGYLVTLPEPMELAARNALNNVVTDLQLEVEAFLENSFDLLIRTLLGLFEVLGFIIGLIVLPTWLLTVLNEQKNATAAINRAMPYAVQPDFWAVARIINRSFNRFMRGQFVIAVTVGLLVYAGLVVMEQLGLVELRYKLAVAMFSALFALVPDLGALIGSLPWILLGFTVSTELGIALIIMYTVVWLFIGQFIQPHVEKRVVDVHPALLVVLIVLLSQLGILWIFLAAPLIAIFRDLLRYTFGRLGDPPQPAGVIPGEMVPDQETAAAKRPVRRPPAAYRRSRPQRR